MNTQNLRVPDYVQQAARLIYETLSMNAPPNRRTMRAKIAQLILHSGIAFSREERRALRGQRSPPELIARLLHDLGEACLVDWGLRNHPRLAQQVGSAFPQMVLDWLNSLPSARVTELHRAAIRQRLEVDGTDQITIQSTLGRFLLEKENMMTPIDDLVTRLRASYFFDTGNGLPDSFTTQPTQDAYIRKVGSVLQRFTLDITKAENDYIVAGIIGTLLQLGRTQLDPAGAFEADVRQAWSRLFTVEPGNNNVPNNEIYAAVEPILRAEHADNKISFQEFAYVGEALSTGETRVPKDDSNFAGLVRVAAQNYLAQRTTFTGLGDLPPLIGEEGGDNEIEADNVRAVAWVYAAHQYEQMRLFDVVDRITELFMNGMLPIGLDTGGHALDRYHWDNEDRLTTAARHSQYARVLGVAGGEVSREVQPNTEFHNLWMRFLSSLAEYDRQFRMSDLFNQRRGLATTGEHVRKAGRDLAANASLYGWASTHFVARRLEKQIRDTINILRMPSIQKAYAVNSPWQVIERVASQEFGQAPNMVRYDTMARAGKIILDLVAKHARIWSSTTGQPLFSENDQPGDINDVTDRDTLMTQTQYWLAVNGIKDSEIDQLSQPVASVVAPSIPPTGKDTSPNLDQLRQMVTQGQMPSLNQLQQLVGMNGQRG